nr:hypothetical protein CFP56_78396 [Quercus suber]
MQPRSQADFLNCQNAPASESGLVQMPRPVHHLWPLKFLQKNRGPRVTVEEFGLESQSHGTRSEVVHRCGIPRIHRLRPSACLRKRKWTITFVIMVIMTIVFCVLGVVHRVLGRMNGSVAVRQEMPTIAYRAPFICGQKPAHWECTAKFEGPRAANVEDHFTVQEWMDENCAWQKGEIIGFWLCGEKLGFDHGVPGGEGTYVEKVSDAPMDRGHSKHSSGLKYPPSS